MEQLIKITTVPIEYEMKITDARVERRRGEARIAISRDEGGLRIRSEPVRLNMDTYDARNSITPTAMTSVEQAANKGNKAAFDAGNRYSDEITQMTWSKPGEGNETINSMLASRLELPTGQFNIDFLPSVGPNIDWTPPEISVKYEMDKLNFDARVNSGSVEFIPGAIELMITQNPSVTIEYIGSPIYVPPRSDDSGSVLDEMA